MLRDDAGIVAPAEGQTLRGTCDETTYRRLAYSSPST